MLLDDDVVTDRQAKARALASWLGGEERIEHLFPDLRRNANTVVANPDLHAVAEAFGHSRNGRLEPVAAFLSLALGRRIEAVCDQVQENPRDLLGEDIDFTGRGVKGPLQSDIEALFLGSRTVVGEIEALLDDCIDIDQPTFARAFARMQQHVLDDGVGSLAVLHDLIEVVAKGVGQFIDLRTRRFVDMSPREERSCNSSISSTETPEKLLTKLSGFLISWAIPAVNWPSEASFWVWTRRSCAVRRSSSDFANSLVRSCSASNSRTFSIAMTAWSANVVTSSICLSVNGFTSVRVSESTPTGIPRASEARQAWCDIRPAVATLRTCIRDRSSIQNMNDLALDVVRPTRVSAPGAMGRSIMYSLYSVENPKVESNR